MTPKITVSGGRVSLSFGAPSVPPRAGAAQEALPLPILAPDAPAESGWTGHYHIQTRGMTDDEIVDEIGRVRLHHEKKVMRLDGFRSLINSNFIVNGVQYKIAHVSVGERGTNVELYAAAESESGARTTVQVLYRTVDDVPTNAEIVDMLTNSIRAAAVTVADNAAQASRLRALLGEDGRG